jgi:SAM-dependent methyltransferase
MNGSDTPEAYRPPLTPTGSLRKMNDSPEDRTAKWLVGDRLACVLHLGDSSLAYQLAEQGHEVVVAGDDVTASRHEDIQYVRSQGERLPFLAGAFDVVIAPELREAPMALAEYARVLRPDGLLSTISQHYDDSIPWMRKLREITGERGAPATPVDTFTASGLFHEPETHEFGTWEKLDLPGLMRFAEADPANERFFADGTRAGHHQFDIEAYVVARLAAAGVRTIEALGLDTYADPARFFSYRRATHRGESGYGRQIALIGL